MALKIDQSRLSRLLVLALPAIAEQFLMTMVSYVDTAMVGSLGAGATAAIAVTASSTWLIGGILSAAGVGFSVQVAYAVGAGDAPLCVTGGEAEWFGLKDGAAVGQIEAPLFPRIELTPELKAQLNQMNQAAKAKK